MWWQKQQLEGCSCKPRNAKDSWKPPEARRRQGRIPPRASERAWPCWHLDLRLLASQTMRAQISAVRSSWFMVLCYTSPRKQTHLLSHYSFNFFSLQADSFLNNLHNFAKEQISHHCSKWKIMILSINRKDLENKDNENQSIEWMQLPGSSDLGTPLLKKEVSKWQRVLQIHKHPAEQSWFFRGIKRDSKRESAPSLPENACFWDVSGD